MKSEGYTHLDEELSYPVYFKENMTQHAGAITKPIYWSLVRNSMLSIEVWVSSTP